MPVDNDIHTSGLRYPMGPPSARSQTNEPVPVSAVDGGEFDNALITHGLNRISGADDELQTLLDDRSIH